MDKRVFLILIFTLFAGIAHSQEIIPQIGFLSDSVKIGESVRLNLHIKYPVDKQIMLPDSNHNYAPFEFIKKVYFPTRCDSNFAFDSVIYELSTFEIDPVQRIELPVFLITKGDSIELISNADSVYLQELILELPDSIKFRENVYFVATKYSFNYPYFFIGFGIFFVLTVVIFIVFGKKIRVQIKLYRLKKEFNKFSKKLESGIGDIRKNEDNQKLIENILVHWKTYMEKLENRPFTKYTSREIDRAGYGSELKNILQNIDKAIYGNINDEQMHKNFESLEDYTLSRYQLKIREVQNG